MPPYVDGFPVQDHNFAVFARDAKESLTPNATQRTTLIVAGVYIVAIFILWCVLSCFRLRSIARWGQTWLTACGAMHYAGICHTCLL